MAKLAPRSLDTAVQNNGLIILAVSYPTTVLASLFVAGRLFSRRRMLGRWRVDDYIILVCLGLVWVSVGFVTAAVTVDDGRHGGTPPFRGFELATVLTVIGLSMGALSFTLTKIAVVLLLIKLLHPPPWHVRLLWTLAAGNILFMVITAILFYLFWVEHSSVDPAVVTGITLAACALSALSDFYFALYPAVVLWSLEMNWRKKLALSVALGFGVCAGAVAAKKCTAVPDLGSADSSRDLVIWAVIEANCVIIAACIPMLMPLLELWFGTNFLSGGSLRLPSLSFSVGTVGGGKWRKTDRR